jgi:Tfp pilus assembly PilM family ATPase/Tfp pilus assembly protein PilN
VNARNVLLQVSPDRMDVIVHAGRKALETRRIPISPEHDPCAWAKAIRRSASVLKPIVEQLDVVGAETRVVYRSPTQAVDLSSLPIRGAGGAVEAAILGCSDSLSYSALSAVCEAVVVGRDNAGVGAQTHVIVAADREDIAEAITELVTGAGLKYVSATPRDAVVLGALAADVLKTRTPWRGRLFIGEQTCFLVISDNGRLHMSRRINLGVDSLISALTRPIRFTGSDESIELDHETAREMLFTHGVPDRDAVVHQDPELTGGQIIPLLQPVLQRMLVDVRQSIRFGVPEEARDGLSIDVSGSGASISGLAELMAAELGVTVVAEPAGEMNDDQALDAETFEAMRQPHMLRDLNLMPRRIAQSRTTGRLKRWLWTGAAAAIAVIGMDAVRYQMRLDDVRREAEAYAARISDHDALKETSARLQGAVDAIVELETRIDDEIGGRIDMRSCLHELSRVTPDRIRFTSVTMRRMEERAEMALVGYAFTPGVAQGADDDLEALVWNLQGSPLFTDVTLGNVQVGSIGDVQGQRFDVTFTVVPTPALDDAEAIVRASEETAS